MKHFDQLEKKLIKFIVEGEDYETNLTNFLDDYLEKTCVVVDKVNKKVKLEFYYEGEIIPSTEEQKWIVSKLKELQKTIVSVVNLIDYLESKGLLLTFKALSRTEEDEFSFGTCASDQDHLGYEFQDQRVNELVLEYFNKELFATPALDLLVKNNFVSREERRFKKRYFATWFAIAVSIVIGLVGFFKNGNQESLELLKKSNSIEQKTLNNFKSFNNSIKSNNQKLIQLETDIDSLINTINSD